MKPTYGTKLITGAWEIDGLTYLAVGETAPALPGDVSPIVWGDPVNKRQPLALVEHSIQYGSQGLPATALTWTWEGAGGDFGYTYGGSRQVSLPVLQAGSLLWTREGNWEPWQFVRIEGEDFALSYNYGTDSWALIRLADGEIQWELQFSYGEYNFRSDYGFLIQDFNDYSIFRFLGLDGKMSPDFQYRSAIWAYWVLFGTAIAWADDYTRLTVAPIHRPVASYQFDTETVYRLSQAAKWTWSFLGAEYPRTVATSILVAAGASGIKWETLDQYVPIRYSRQAMDGYVPPTSAAPYSLPDGLTEEFVEDDGDLLHRAREISHHVHAVDAAGNQAEWSESWSSASWSPMVWPGSSDLAVAARDAEWSEFFAQTGLDFSAAPDLEYYPDPRQFPELELDLTRLIQGGYPGYESSMQWGIAVETWVHGGTWQRGILFQSELASKAPRYSRDFSWLYHNRYAGYEAGQTPQLELITAIDDEIYLAYQTPGFPVLTVSDVETPSALIARRWKGTKSGSYRWDAEKIIVVHDLCSDFDSPPEGSGQTNVRIGGTNYPATTAIVQGYPDYWFYLHTYKGGTWLHSTFVLPDQPSTEGLEYYTYGETLRRDYFGTDPGTEFASGKFVRWNTGCVLAKILRYQNIGGNEKWATSERYQYTIRDSEAVASNYACANLVNDFFYHMTWEPVVWMIGARTKVVCLQMVNGSLIEQWSREYGYDRDLSEGELPPEVALPSQVALAPGKHGTFFLYRLRDPETGQQKYHIDRLQGGAVLWSQEITANYYRSGHDPATGDWILVWDQGPIGSQVWLFGEGGLIADFATAEELPWVAPGLGYQVWVVDGSIYYSKRGGAETLFYKFN